MRNYLTLEYYRDTFQGNPVAEDEFPGLLCRASEIVEEMTLYRLSPDTFQGMSQEMQEKVRMAVAAQIEYLEANGGSEVDNGTDLASATLGKFSYTKAGSGDSVSLAKYAPRTQRILLSTGLLYRGGGSY